MKGVLITSSILIGLIAALRPILRGKIAPRVQYALWLAVALRLLIPVNFVDSAYSVLALLERADEPPQIIQTIGQIPIPAQSYDSAHQQALQEYEQQVERGELVPHISQAEIVNNRTSELMRGPTVAEVAAKLARPVWLGGAALMAGWFLLVNGALRRKLRGAKRLDGVNCILPVYVSDALPSPCLCGAVRPAVYVTPAALESPDRLRHVLAHELTHYRHRDHWWAVVRCVCLCLYWFDPLVWWAAALSRQDCELACDEGAVRILGEGERIPYGRTLVAMIAAGRNPLLQTATTMTGGKKRVRERVQLIARKPKTVIAVALAVALIVGCAVGCTFTGAPEGEDLSLNTLQERLDDIPEELRPQVVNRPADVSVLGEDGVLASYWWDVPAEWEDEFTPWLLAVYQWDQAQYERHTHPQGLGGYGAFDEVVVFARDSEHYYVFDQPSDPRFQMEGAEDFAAAYQAIRTYAMETVLETEGVEPYNPPDAPRPTLNTLQERLLAGPEGIEGLTAQAEEGALASYWLSLGGEEVPLGHAVQWDQVEFENWLYSRDAAAPYTVFARDSEHYYAIGGPRNSTEYIHVIEDATVPYNAACRAVWEYAQQQVLNTQGVSAFDGEELRSRDSIWEGKTYTEVAYWPYKEINGDTEVVWIYRLVQLADQGPNGVWIPEQVQHIGGGVDPTPYHVKPDTGGLTVTEYAAQLQQEADNGNAAWATDPIDAARHYIAGTSNPDDIPLDSFTDNSAVIEDAVAGIGPSEEQQAIQTVMDAILSADEVMLTLVPGGTSRIYPYIILGLTNWEGAEGFWAYRLGLFATEYRWEKRDVLPEGLNEGDVLTIQADGALDCIWLWEGSNIVGIRTPKMEYYEAVANSYGDPLDTDIWNPGPFGYIRWWFDEVELSLLRTTSVPDRGQSHLEVVEEWIDGFEGAMLKCAPGSMYACTYVQPQNVVADAHIDLSPADLEDFARSRGEGRGAEDYGKTWFTFYYSLVFVPENETAKAYLEAGNTEDYTGDDAPEGARIWQRVAYMWLEDGQWVCQGTGTGW